MPLNKGRASKQKCIPGDRPRTSNIVAANRKQHLTIAVGAKLLLFLLVLAFSSKSNSQTTATPLFRSSTTPRSTATTRKQRGKTHYRAPKKGRQRKRKSGATLKKRKTHKKPFPWGVVILTAGVIAFVCLLLYFLFSQSQSSVPSSSQSTSQGNNNTQHEQHNIGEGKGGGTDDVDPESANVGNSMSPSSPLTNQGNGDRQETQRKIDDDSSDERGMSPNDECNEKKDDISNSNEGDIVVYFYVRKATEKNAQFDLLFSVEPPDVFLANNKDKKNNNIRSMRKKTYRKRTFRKRI